jgi:predicted nuclease of predicted toxin-antitoxin system
VKFKLDENLPIALAADLRFAGHDVDTVADENLTGASDPIVVAAALRERRVVLTPDRGIADHTRHPASTHAGVVLFRSNAADRKEVLRFIRSREDRVTLVSAQRIRGR